jgi:hypothetical protein
MDRDAGCGGVDPGRTNGDMSLMRLHVLAGCRALLIPDALRGMQIPILLDEPKIRIATAFWLSPRCGQFYHDFLLEAENDNRVAVFARSLREDFGNRFEPLVVLPELITETTAAIPPEHGRRGTLDVLLELCKERAEGIMLHALVLPRGVDADGSWAGPDELLAPQARGRLDGLRATLAASGLQPERIETRVAVLPRAAPGFAQVFRNAISRQIAKRIRPRLGREGLDAEIPRLEAAIARILAGWNEAGIVPANALGADALDVLSERVSAKLFAHARSAADA